MPFRRSDIVLAAMAPAPRHVWFDPVRVQKLLFLVDMQIPALIDGPHFNFRPYLCGPFDLNVYLELEALTERSYVQTDRTLGHLRYKLTHDGYARGATELAKLPEQASDFLVRACRWILATSFSDLLASIYRHFPEMKGNAIMPWPASEYNAPIAEHNGRERNPRVTARAIGDAWRRTGDHIRAAMGQ